MRIIADITNCADLGLGSAPIDVGYAVLSGWRGSSVGPATARSRVGHNQTVADVGFVEMQPWPVGRWIGYDHSQ